MSIRRKQAAELLLREMKKSLNPPQDLFDLAVDASVHAVEVQREADAFRKQLTPRQREEAERQVKKQRILDAFAGQDLFGARRIVDRWTTLGGEE